MIISWVLAVIGVILWWALFAYFASQGYVTDEDVFESGIAEGFWPSIIGIWAASSYLVGFPVAVISSITFIIVYIIKRKRGVK